jgi:DNA-binding Lrp family transcriptional regulator
MDATDRKILDVLQQDFPSSERPYDVLAQKLGIGSDELLKRISRLVEEGVIRRIGVILDSGGLGFCSTLAAVRVKGGDVDKAAEVIGRFSEVTHSYLREDEFNIWFTIIAGSQERIGEILEKVRAELGLSSCDILNLPAKRVFKIDARFKTEA